MSFRYLIIGATFASLPFCVSADVLPDAARAAQIVILGETHDNPGHHARQARWVADLTPAALVFEMLTEAQAAVITPKLRRDQNALAAAFGWEQSGWPDFAMYYPIFDAAPQARIYGAAVPRQQAQQAMAEGSVASFGPKARLYGLTVPVAEPQLSARLALQHDAHCGALPAHLLPKMVEFQRLRDATLAKAALSALAETGGPVVVITGNGHARSDWGVPSYLVQIDAMLDIFVLGQGEAGLPPEGSFDLVMMSDAIEREDPCVAFN